MGRATARLGTVLLAAGLAAAGAPCVQATTLLHQDLGDLVDQAELIFVGTVLHAESVPTGDGAFAFTFVTFEVEETLQGATRDRRLTLRLAGGELPRLPLESEWIEVSGVPRFEVGGRHLLFVDGNGKHGCPVVGGPQGKFDLVAHPLSGDTMVVDSGGRAIAGAEGREWIYSDLAVTADGLLKGPAEPGMVVLHQDPGIEIVLDDPAPGGHGKAPPLAASQVLAELRSTITARSSGGGHQAPRVVESASTSDVPASFRFRAVPAPTR